MAERSRRREKKAEPASAVREQRARWSELFERDDAITVDLMERWGSDAVVSTHRGGAG